MWWAKEKFSKFWSSLTLYSKCKVKDILFSFSLQSLVLNLSSSNYLNWRISWRKWSVFWKWNKWEWSLDLLPLLDLSRSLASYIETVCKQFMYCAICKRSKTLVLRLCSLLSYVHDWVSWIDVVLVQRQLKHIWWQTHRNGGVGGGLFVYFKNNV